MPRFYNSTDAPGTPEQGDLRYNKSNNQLEVYTGSAWGGITFNAVTAGSVTVDNLTVSAGFPSLNTTTPAFYIPAGAGPLTGLIPSLALRVPIAYDTVGRKLMIRTGGSWFTSVTSFALA